MESRGLKIDLVMDPASQRSSSRRVRSRGAQCTSVGRAGGALGILASANCHLARQSPSPIAPWTWLALQLDAARKQVVKKSELRTFLRRCGCRQGNRYGFNRRLAP